MRAEVSQLVGKGLLPSSTSGADRIKEWNGALEKIVPPLSDEEATALTKLFPAVEDDCYGLAWTLIHLIETAPHWPLDQCLQNTDNPWILYLRQRSSGE
jgi:hypothetical protein